MIYRIRYRSRGKQELTACKDTYDPEVSEQLDRWLNELAADASKISKNEPTLPNVLEALEEIFGKNKNRQWDHIRRKLRDASALEKARALYELVKRRKAPWQLLYSERFISFLHGKFSRMAGVIYEVDRVKKEIVLVKFIDLPPET